MSRFHEPRSGACSSELLLPLISCEIRIAPSCRRRRLDPVRARGRASARGRLHIGWHHSILDLHQWRQSPHRASAFEMTRGGPFWRYVTADSRSAVAVADRDAAVSMDRGDDVTMRHRSISTPRDAACRSPSSRPRSSPAGSRLDIRRRQAALPSDLRGADAGEPSAYMLLVENLHDRVDRAVLRGDVRAGDASRNEGRRDASQRVFWLGRGDRVRRSLAGW